MVMAGVTQALVQRGTGRTAQSDKAVENKERYCSARARMLAADHIYLNVHKRDDNDHGDDDRDDDDRDDDDCDDDDCDDGNRDDDDRNERGPGANEGRSGGIRMARGGEGDAASDRHIGTDGFAKKKAVRRGHGCQCRREKISKMDRWTAVQQQRAVQRSAAKCRNGRGEEERLECPGSTPAKMFLCGLALSKLMVNPVYLSMRRWTANIHNVPKGILNVSSGEGRIHQRDHAGVVGRFFLQKIKVASCEARKSA